MAAHISTGPEFVTVESQVVSGMRHGTKYLKGLNLSDLINEVLVDSGYLNP